MPKVTVYGPSTFYEIQPFRFISLWTCLACSRENLAISVYIIVEMPGLFSRKPSHFGLYLCGNAWPVFYENLAISTCAPRFWGKSRSTTAAQSFKCSRRVVFTSTEDSPGSDSA